MCKFNHGVVDEESGLEDQGFMFKTGANTSVDLAILVLLTW